MKNLFIIILLLSFFSCKNTKEINFLELFEKKEDITLLPFNNVIIDSLMSPDIFISAGDYLIFSEPKLPYLLSSYNFKTHAFKRFLRKGQGVNEAINIQTLGQLNNDNSFYAHDVMSQSIFLFSINDLSETIEKDSLPSSYNVSSLAYDDNLAFYMIVGDSARFVVKHDDNFVSLGEMPKVDDILPQVLSQSLQGPSLVSFENKKLAWFSVYGDIMEIYNYSNPNNIYLVKSSVVNLPVYSKSSERNSGVLALNTKLSVSSVTSDGKYIYALYNENKIEDAVKKGDDIFFCKKILVFDWEGNPVKILNVDRQLRSITYRKEDGKLYCLGLAENLDPAVYFFSINNLDL